MRKTKEQKRRLGKRRSKSVAINKIVATMLVSAMVLTNLSSATLYVNATGEVDSTILEDTSTDGIDSLSVGTYDSWGEVAAAAEAGTDYTLDGTEETVQIHTAAGLAWFAAQVNAGEGYPLYTVNLTNAIDLRDAGVTGYDGTGNVPADTVTADNSWTPIGRAKIVGAAEEAVAFLLYRKVLLSRNSKKKLPTDR